MHYKMNEMIPSSQLDDASFKLAHAGLLRYKMSMAFICPSWSMRSIHLN